MKTPRQLLLERHRSAEPRLDALRKTVLQNTSKRKRENAFVDSAFSLRQLFLSLRWHFAGMSAVWIFVLFLNSESSTRISPVAAQNTPSPAEFVTALRENRRQIAELTGAPVAVANKTSRPESVLPPRRSEVDFQIQIA